ncbi:hypothetical protein RE474_13295 [Methanolobus sediminis]|uniref:Calcineurin-like phosphoesterase domain-containing protein n=1 Tax=Methanolobus sediminis TaxID=3072978 RepID=A0AA51UKN5_9EURY|nr:hypothetical protein [Methanolobus sediminis]WMW25037.1 hypothetical protein RE474_13295 [Methanolobus sediminis]
MKVYETFCEQICLASHITGNAADKLWDNILSKRSLWDDLKKFPSEPRSAFMSMRQPPERRIRNYLKNNIFKEMRDLAGSDTRHFQLHMRPEQYLIYGHTHDAYVDDGRRVANTGSLGFGDEHKLEYIEIIDDKVELKGFNPHG